MIPHCQAGFFKNNNVQDYNNVGILTDSQINKIIYNYNSGNLNRNSPIKYNWEFKKTNIEWLNISIPILQIKKIIAR